MLTLWVSVTIRFTVAYEPTYTSHTRELSFSGSLLVLLPIPTPLLLYKSLYVRPECVTCIHLLNQYYQILPPEHRVTRDQ